MPVLIILTKVSLFVKGSTKLADFNTVRTLAIALNPNANFLKDQQQVQLLILDQFREARENVKQLVTQSRIHHIGLHFLPFKFQVKVVLYYLDGAVVKATTLGCRRHYNQTIEDILGSYNLSMGKNISFSTLNCRPCSLPPGESSPLRGVFPSSALAVGRPLMTIISSSAIGSWHPYQHSVSVVSRLYPVLLDMEKR